MKIRLGELRTVIREVLAENYDDWKTATPPEYETMGQEPCAEPCPEELECPYCTGQEPGAMGPDEDDLMSMRYGREK